MKHGISPTTPRGQVYARFVHISKPLALAFRFQGDELPRDPETGKKEARVIYLPVWTPAEEWPKNRRALGVVKAPVSNTFSKPQEPARTRQVRRQRSAVMREVRDTFRTRVSRKDAERIVAAIGELQSVGYIQALNAYTEAA